MKPYVRTNRTLQIINQIERLLSSTSRPLNSRAVVKQLKSKGFPAPVCWGIISGFTRSGTVISWTTRRVGGPSFFVKA